jgi:hypothetical protein
MCESPGKWWIGGNVAEHPGDIAHHMALTSVSRMTIRSIDRSGGGCGETQCLAMIAWNVGSYFILISSGCAIIPHSRTRNIRHGVRSPLRNLFYTVLSALKIVGKFLLFRLIIPARRLGVSITRFLLKFLGKFRISGEYMHQFAFGEPS